MRSILERTRHHMYTQHAKLIDAMIEYDKGDARRIETVSSFV